MSTHRILIFIGVVAVLSIAGWFRFAGLGDRPIHFDEATGARIMGERLETGRYVFDPEHFHGPLLSFISIPVVRLCGASSWEELTKENLRLGVAVLSLLTVFGALAIGRFGGRGDGLMAAAFVALSLSVLYRSQAASPLQSSRNNNAKSKIDKASMGNLPVASRGTTERATVEPRPTANHTR